MRIFEILFWGNEPTEADRSDPLLNLSRPRRRGLAPQRMGLSQGYCRRSRQGAPGRAVHPLSRRQLGDRLFPLVVDRHRGRRPLGRGGSVELRGLICSHNRQSLFLSGLLGGLPAHRVGSPRSGALWQQAKFATRVRGAAVSALALPRVANPALEQPSPPARPAPSHSVAPGLQPPGLTSVAGRSPTNV